jgi:hypothetical protein
MFGEVKHLGQDAPNEDGSGLPPLTYSIHQELGVMIPIGDATAIIAATGTAGSKTVQTLIDSAPDEASKTGALVASIAFLSTTKRAMELLDSCELEATLDNS